MTAPATENTATESAEVDLTEFKQAVELVVTGDPELVKDSTDKVRVVYRELGRKGMAAARAYLSELGNQVVLEGDLDKAQKVIKLSQEILKPAPTGRKGATTPKAPKDPTADHVEHVAAIQLGYSVSVLEAPEGIDEDWRAKVAEKADEAAQEQARVYREFLLNKQEGVEPEVPEFIKAGARISLGRAPKGQGRKPKSVEDAAERNALAGATTAAEAVAAQAPAQVATEAPAEAPASTDTPVTQETVDAFTQAVG